MPVLHPLTIEEFDNILMNTSNKYVFVDFFATWCKPCNRIAPKLEKMSEIYKNVTFLKIDVDVVNEASTRYNISAMPTFLVFNSGFTAPIFQPIVGADEVKIENMLKMISGNAFNGDDF